MFAQNFVVHHIHIIQITKILIYIRSRNKQQSIHWLMLKFSIYFIMKHLMYIEIDSLMNFQIKFNLLIIHTCRFVICCCWWYALYLFVNVQCFFIIIIIDLIGHKSSPISINKQKLTEYTDDTVFFQCLSCVKCVTCVIWLDRNSFFYLLFQASELRLIFFFDFIIDL